MAVLLYHKGEYRDAEPLYRRALAIFEKELGKDYQNTAECLNGLAILLHSKGDHGGAEPLYRRVLAIKENVLGKDHPDTIQTLFNLAQLLDVKGDHGKASVLYKQIVSTDETVLKRIGTPKPLWINLMAVSYNALAFISCVPEKNWKEAEHYYQKAIELFSKVPDPLEAANSELNLQTMYHISGQQVDVERVKALTRILEEANDKRAEKGHKILKEISE